MSGEGGGKGSSRCGENGTEMVAVEGSTPPPLGLHIRGRPELPRQNGDGGDRPGHDLHELPPAKLFGRAVMFLRRGRRVRQVDLAARAGISLGRLSGIENGEYVTWRKAADRIARALDFADAAELLLRFYGADLPVEDVRALLEAPPERPDGDGE